MQLSISSKLVLLVTLLVTASAATISYYLYQSGSQILVQHALQDLSHNLQRDGDQLSSRIQEVQRNVLFLANSPPIPGLIRATQNRGYDPLGQSSQALWMARLTTLFQTMLNTNPDYAQVRLLDQRGQERLKLIQDDRVITVVTGPSLQDKSRYDYFQETVKLQTGQTFISPVNLNREFGKISLPHQPTLRCATPVYAAGKLYGVIVINLGFGSYLNQLEQTYGAHNETLYVTNSDGAYLSHPDPSRRFAFELGHHYRLQEDFPVIADLFAPSNRDLSRNIIPTDTAGNIMVFVKIPFNPQQPDMFIGVGLERSYAQILAGETKILQRSLAIISLFVLLSILFALGFGNLLVRPLKAMVNNLDGYAKGDKPSMPIRRQDEIGVLARALETMADNIFSSHQQLRSLNAHLEEEVEERTAEVQQHLQMVNAINQAQSAFIRERNPQHAFDLMLANLLELSQSEFGFIGEVLHDAAGQPYVRIYVTTNIAWDEVTRKFYEDNIQDGLEFRQLDNLFGQAVLTGETVISNDPASDPRATGLPPGHPGLHTFMGIPIHYADKLIGMVAIANRANGYSEDLIDSLLPFLNTCANLILAHQTQRAAEQSAIALSETRSELERVTSISPVIFYVARAYGDYGASFVSPNIQSLMGYTQEECLADPGFWRNNIHPDDRDRVFAALGQVYETGHHIHSYRFRHKNGYYHWIHDELQMIRDARGEPKELAGYWLDITERKLAELKLQQSERELATILDNLPLMMFIKDAEELRFMQFNRAGEQLLGLSRNELLGKNDYDFFPREQADFFVAKDREVLNSGCAIDIPEEPIQTPQGERILHTRKTVITDASGKPLYLLGLSEDITEAKRIQDELSRFKATLDQTQDCVFMFSADTLQFFYVNQGAMILVGYSQQELMQMHPYDLNSRINTPDEFRQFVKPLLNGSHPSFKFEAEYRCKDQSVVPVEVLLQYITHEGQAPRFVAMVRDITERRKIDRMKNEFVSTVSHELRTPLTSIRGSLGLINGGAVGELPEQMQQMLQIASNNTDRLLLLINDILDIQKIESGQMSFRFTPIDIMSLLEQAVRDNSTYADQYAVSFEITLRKDGVHVLADRDRLMQVLSNLMSNAAKFSPAGDTIELSVAQHGDAVRVSVSDHGDGIPEEFQPRLFEQFSQSDASDTRQKGGTGLGLSIVKAIIDKHGGRVDYITRQGLGTTMIIELPVCKPTQTISNDTYPTRLGTHQPCILILEDDLDIATLLNRLLSAAGYSCDIAHSVSQAKHLLHQHLHHYKAITLDIRLPDSDGVAFLRELRSDPASQSLPVIVVSVEADEARRRLNGGAIGIIDWLDKPIDEQRLLQSLSSACTQTTQSRILHIEDESDVHQIVKTLLADKVKLDWAKNLHKAQKLLTINHYDLILLDLSLPDGSGLSLLSRLEQQHPTSKLVVYSAHELAPEYMLQVHAALTKANTDNQMLLATIESLLANN